MIQRLQKKFSIVSRIFLAIFGSYLLATGANLACLALPTDTISTVFIGYVVSILVCAVSIIMIFSFKKVWHAWMAVLLFSGMFFSIWRVFAYVPVS